MASHRSARRSALCRRSLGPAILMVALLGAATPRRAAAQDAEPKFDALVSNFQTEALKIGVLLQAIGDIQGTRIAPGMNGFSVGAAWIRLRGSLDGGFGYLFQSNLALSPSVLDAAVSYRAGDAVTVQAGRFKVPFSAEFLIYAGSIDFVSRSQVVAALAPNRDAGVQVSGRPGSGAVEYVVGAFNGNRSAAGNDDGELLYAARVVWRPAIATASSPDDALEVAVNVANSNDTAAPIGIGFIPAFTGTRTLVGADMRLTRGPWLATAEFISARLEPTVGPVRRPEGWQATGGYELTPKSQALLRWDVFRAAGIGPDVEQIVVGYNRWPTKATELQLNYIVPTNLGGFNHHRILVNLQLGF